MVGTPQEVMFRGLDLHRAGNLDEAAQIYRSVLAQDPANVDTMGLLGMVHLQQGRPAEAVALMTHAARMRPGVAAIHSHLGLAWQSMGRLADAASEFRQALALDETDAGAHVNLGVTLRTLNRRDEAIVHLRKAIELAPTLAEAQTNLGELLLEMKRPEEALEHCRLAVELQPELAEAHNNLGNVLRILRRFAEARKSCMRAIELKPNLAQAYASIGLSFADDEWNEVLPWLKKAIELEPENVDYLAYYADTAAEHEMLAEAEDCCHRVLSVNPRHAMALNTLGWLYQVERHTKESLQCYQAAIAAKPDFAKAHFNLGGLYEQMGEFAKAETSYRLAITLEPASEAAMSKLATILRDRLPVEDKVRMQARLDAAQAPAPLRASLLFGLAQVQDAHRDYLGAARSLSEANRLSVQVRTQRGQGFDLDGQRELVDRLTEVTTGSFFARLAGSGLRTKRPVFVFGLPRSGTSLIEQILASHSRVHGAGELPFSIRGFESIPAVAGRTGRPVDALANLTKDQLTRLAAQHEQWLSEVDDNRSDRIIDKLPGNYYHLGMIALMFPDATLIHCRRDPRDVAVSCWIANFRTINWANHIDHLAGHFEVYSRLMEHWRKVLPVPIIEVNYHEIVTNFEPEANRLVAACGLEWEPACLEFHRSERPVRTASAAQVRQPIYRGSLERWRNYAQDPELNAVFDRVLRLPEFAAWANNS